MQDNENNTIGAIVKGTRLQLGANLQRNITQEEFGELLVAGLVEASISRVAVSSWENGKYEPDSDLLWTLVVYHYGTGAWQLSFALACLRAKLPEVFEIIELRLPVGA